MIFKEGEPCSKVIFVQQGEVEIIKTDLSSIYYNHDNAVLAMKEHNEKAQLIKSEYRPPELV